MVRLYPFSGVEYSNAAPKGLSTVSGVFAPVALSMFSILLFLRMGKALLLVLLPALFQDLSSASLAS